MKTRNSVTNIGKPEYVQRPDYPTLRNHLKDYESTFYGPSNCDGCGTYNVVRKAFEQGAQSWEERECKGGVEYIPHHCSHVLLFKRLAGKVLTVVDAAFPPSSPQLKAIKDLLKREFAETIARARELEGDRCGEINPSFEALAS